MTNEPDPAVQPLCFNRKSSHLTCANRATRQPKSDVERLCEMLSARIKEKERTNRNEKEAER